MQTGLLGEGSLGLEGCGAVEDVALRVARAGERERERAGTVRSKDSGAG